MVYMVYMVYRNKIIPTDFNSMIFQRVGSTNQMISIVKPILPNSLGGDLPKFWTN